MIGCSWEDTNIDIRKMVKEKFGLDIPDSIQSFEELRDYIREQKKP